MPVVQARQNDRSPGRDEHVVDRIAAGPRRREEVARAQGAVDQVVRDLTVERIGPVQRGLRDGAGMGELGAVVDRVDADLAHHLLIRAHRLVLGAGHRIADVRAVHRDAVGPGPAAVERVAVDPVVSAGGFQDPVVGAAPPHDHVAQRPLVNQVGDLGRFGLDHRRQILHDDLLRGLPDLEHDVDPDGLVRLEHHALADEALEPRQLGGHAVASGLQVGRAVGPLVVASGRALEPGLQARNGDLHARDDRAGLVRDVSEDFALDGLGGRGSRRACPERQTEDRAAKGPGGWFGRHRISPYVFATADGKQQNAPGLFQIYLLNQQ